MIDSCIGQIEIRLTFTLAGYDPNNMTYTINFRNRSHICIHLDLDVLYQNAKAVLQRTIP